jgi:predicted dehydrogenase
VKQKTEAIFETDKRIRLGIWGLGRGQHFFKSCAALNMDVVAGCDQNDMMLDRFRENVHGAQCFKDAREFLKADLDAVLLATFCPDHGLQAIRCLEAGKHVLSEVTAFHTPAEGVRLVEAVEKSGLVYNMAENYPFSKQNMYLAQKWQAGLFGNLVYAENEYVHDCRRALSFTHGIGGPPIQPGWTLHQWRSWKHWHYYCTHALGPIMYITGSRPTRVVSLPGETSMGANVTQVKAAGISTVAPSLIQMDNGGLVRNFMGTTPHDTHQMRIWGTVGAVEKSDKFRIGFGADGHSRMLEVQPEWPALGNLAETMGHGGGDFWVLYYFARQVLTGEPAFWDVYRSADVTLPGIFAYRSALENGKAYDLPDLRTKKGRDAVRDDDFAQKRYNWKKGPFPKNADKRKLAGFTSVMKGLIEKQATVARAMLTWLPMADDAVDTGEIVNMADEFIAGFDEMRKSFARARRMIKLHPQSDGAQILREMLEAADAKTVSKKSFLEQVKKVRRKLKRKLRK